MFLINSVIFHYSLTISISSLCPRSFLNGPTKQVLFTCDSGDEESTGINRKPSVNRPEVVQTVSSHALKEMPMLFAPDDPMGP